MRKEVSVLVEEEKCEAIEWIMAAFCKVFCFLLVVLKEKAYLCGAKRKYMLVHHE
jgi:hypothetical protein